MHPNTQINPLRVPEITCMKVWHPNPIREVPRIPVARISPINRYIGKVCCMDARANAAPKTPPIPVIWALIFHCIFMSAAVMTDKSPPPTNPNTQGGSSNRYRRIPQHMYDIRQMA